MFRAAMLPSGSEAERFIRFLKTENHQSVPAGCLDYRLHRRADVLRRPEGPARRIYASERVRDGNTTRKAIPTD